MCVNPLVLSAVTLTVVWLRARARGMGGKVHDARGYPRNSNDACMNHHAQRYNGRLLSEQLANYDYLSEQFRINATSICRKQNNI
jgi:hypothetical protein